MLHKKITNKDTKKLKKYFAISEKCCKLSIICMAIITILFMITIVITSFKKADYNLFIEPTIILGLIMTFIGLVSGNVASEIVKELERRQKEEDVKKLKSVQIRKIKINNFKDIDFKELFKDAKIEAEYNDESEVVYITFFIKDDNSCTEISKTVGFKKDDIISKIEIV